MQIYDNNTYVPNPLLSPIPSALCPSHTLRSLSTRPLTAFCLVLFNSLCLCLDVSFLPFTHTLPRNSPMSCPVLTPVPYPHGVSLSLELGASSLRRGSRLDSSLWPLPGCIGLGPEKGLTECLQTLAHGHTVGEQQDSGLNPGPLSSLPRTLSWQQTAGAQGWCLGVENLST